MSREMLDKDHYEAIKDIHVNLENRNHAIDEYGYGPLNPNEDSKEFWQKKADLWNTSIEEAKKSRCYNCSAFNQTPEMINAMAQALGPVGDKIVKKTNLGFCELFDFKCAGERTCDAWLMNGPIKEDAPVNSAGAGNIAGIGVGPKGEPGVNQRSRKQHKNRVSKEQEAQTMNIAFMRRATPMMENVKTGSFAGNQTFIVPSTVFQEAKMQKKKGKHWRTYIGDHGHWKHIREYATKHPKKAIILQDERTGAMCYARYSKGK